METRGIKETHLSACGLCFPLLGVPVATSLQGPEARLGKEGVPGAELCYGCSQIP
jgi:hypothetical protein